MITFCSWCGKKIADDHDPATANQVSHGVCKPCADEEEAKAQTEQNDV